MTRGLPASLVVHTVALLLVILFGSHVQRQPVQPARAIRVRMVQLPEARPAPVDPAPEAAAQAVPEPAATPEMPPKELPREPERKRPEPEPEQKPVERQPPPETPAATPENPAENAPEPTVSLLPAGPAVAGTDSDFPFAWYVSRIEGLIVQNWQPRQLGFSHKALVSCQVHFNIARGGAVSQVTLVQASGIGVYDREALRAVQTTRLPPLPPQYGASSLGVTFIFNLEPGNQ